MKKLLFQVCCAPCGTYTTYESLAPRFDVTWFFCNPNLVNKSEYDRRLEAVVNVTQKFGWPLIIDPYEHSQWQKMTCGRGGDPERGPRCQLCYRDRLFKTAKLASEKGFDLFGTSLLVSPYKDAAGITALGSGVASVFNQEFLAEDFQVNDGYRKSQALAKDLGLYRQKFCGCEYSLSPELAKSILLSLFISACFLMGFGFSVQAADIDTDGDGFSDQEEILNDYSPFNPDAVNIKDSDVDQDGLSDYWELKYATDPFLVDTDGDGYGDFEEIDMAFDPLSAESVRLSQEIEIDLKNQKMLYKVGEQVWRSWPVSTGKASMPTPAGKFKIANKAIKPWSKAYGLWMPYWLGLAGESIRTGSIGIHELPVWPGGYREGEDHLGKPVSHGCIRLGVGSAQYLYERVEPGVVVIIQ